MTDSDYRTTNKDGIFVAGKVTTRYRGEKIKYLGGKYYSSFPQIQSVWYREFRRHISEIHYLSSETKVRSLWPRAGHPSPNHGCNAWVRIKFTSGKMTPWICVYDGYPSPECCARDIMVDVGNDMYLRPETYTLFVIAAYKDKNYTVYYHGDLPVGARKKYDDTFLKNLKTKLRAFMQRQH